MYIGFWLRLLAYIVDSVILYSTLFLSVYFMAHLFRFIHFTPTEWFFHSISIAAPAVYYVGFWAKKQATVGKMLIGVKIIDAKTRSAPTPRQCAIRYFAGILSAIPLFLGYIWIAFDAKKRGWHDILAETLVVSSEDGI
jgi:uncharacterized RDD family membrane protein YckC